MFPSCKFVCVFLFLFVQVLVDTVLYIKGVIKNIFILKWSSLVGKKCTKRTDQPNRTSEIRTKWLEFPNCPKSKLFGNGTILEKAEIQTFRFQTLTVFTLMQSFSLNQA